MEFDNLCCVFKSLMNIKDDRQKCFIRKIFIVREKWYKYPNRTNPKIQSFGFANWFHWTMQILLENLLKDPQSKIIYSI